MGTSWNAHLEMWVVCFEEIQTIVWVNIVFDWFLTNCMSLIIVNWWLWFQTPTKSVRLSESPIQSTRDSSIDPSIYPSIFQNIQSHIISYMPMFSFAILKNYRLLIFPMWFLLFFLYFCLIIKMFFKAFFYKNPWSSI